MFRRSNSDRGQQSLLGGIGNSMNGNSNASLPMTGIAGKYRRSPNTSFISYILTIFDRKDSSSNSSNKQRVIDGSASSIHIGPTVGEAWVRAETSVKVTWILLLTTIFTIYMGYRYIRYYNSGVLLDCITTTCTVRLVHEGFGTPTVITIGRQQLVRTEPIKVTKNGTYVSGSASLQVDYKNNNNPKYNPRTHGVSYTDSLNYEGPDENGHYLSYALYFKDKNTSGVSSTSKGEEYVHNEYDLFKIKPYLTKIHNDNEQEDDIYRIIIKQQVPVSFVSKRRVRSMTQKIDAYIKNRRNHLIARETSGPAWQGIVLLVLSIMGFLLTLLLGQFTNDTSNSYYNTTEYGKRRQQQQYYRDTKQYQKNKFDNVLHSRQTPSQYEVRTGTKPSIPQQQQPPPTNSKGQGTTKRIPPSTTIKASPSKQQSSSSLSSSAISQASTFASKIGYQPNISVANRRR